MLASPTVASDRIKIVVVVTALPIGGAERHLLQLMRLIDRERFDLSIVCLKEGGALHETFVAEGNRVTVLGIGRRHELRSTIVLTRLLRAERPAIVIAWSFSAEVIGRVAGRIAGVPARMVWKHNIGGQGLRWRERIANRAVEPLTTGYLGVAFAQVRHLIEDLGVRGDKIRIVQLGVEPDRFWPPPDAQRANELRASLGLEPHHRVVAKVAVIRPEKDHPTFLRAGRMLMEQVPNARLLVVGGAPDDGIERMRALAAELDIADRVVFTGPRSDIPDLLGITDVAVLASYTVECFPVSILEAAAAGVPAVCTAVGGVAEMVDHGSTGYLVPPKDPQRMARLLAEVLTEEGRAAAMGAAARQRMLARFTLDRCVRETEDEFADIVATTGPRRG